MLIKIFILTLGISLAACRHIQFYRKDYTYFEEFDAFYKLHSDGNGVSWSTAFFACENEGSHLFYPKSPEECKIVNNLIELKGVANENFTDIYVGIKEEGITDFLTIDGLFTPSPLQNDKDLQTGDLCTTMDIENGSLHIDLCSNTDSISKPFVCKKVEDVSCPTIDKGYKYVKETKKCYKVNKREQSWHDALNNCVMEGGLLTNIESEMEARILSNLIIPDTYYHIGFKKMPPSEEYYNLKGQNIKDTYEKFYNTDDNNFDCGAFINYGSTLYLKKIECGSKIPFVCEMEISF